MASGSLASKLLDEPPDSSSRSVVTRAEAPQSLKSNHADTARKSEVSSRPTPAANARPVSKPAPIQANPESSVGAPKSEPSAADIPVDLASAISADKAEPSIADIPVDLASAISADKAEPSELEIPVDLASSIAATSLTGRAEESTESTDSPVKPLVKRRAVLMGLAAIVAIVVFAMSLGSRSPLGRSRAQVVSADHSADIRPTLPSAVAVPPAAVPTLPSAQATHEASLPQSGGAATVALEAQDEVAKIAINIKPDGASLYYKGKVAGKTPFILKQPRGEKRSYEVGKPGYKTRRLTITGNEGSIGFELGMDTPHPEGL